MPDLFNLTPEMNSYFDSFAKRYAGKCYSKAVQKINSLAGFKTGCKGAFGKMKYPEKIRRYLLPHGSYRKKISP